MPDQTESDASEAQRVVRRMGGPSKAAAFFGIRQPAVSQWIASGRIPPARRLHLMHLHPEWFKPEPRGTEGAPAIQSTTPQETPDVA